MYYLGFLAQDPKHVVIFKSVKTPKKDDFKYFTSVSGPYETEVMARYTLKQMKRQYGYKENPCECASVSQIRRGTKHELEHTTDRAIARKIAMDHLKEDPRYYTHLTKMEKQYKRNPFSGEKAVGITKKLIRAYEAYRQENPGKAYHDQKFIQHMKELEKYKIGSAPYISTLAKAYEHLESAKESMR